MTRPPPTIVFDLDGTLADTAPDLIAVLNRIMVEEGLPAVGEADARGIIGAGARALVERGFEAGRRELAPARSDELFRRFLALYGERICVETRLFPHVPEALDGLAGRGFRLAVCTNKIEDQALRVLDGLGILARFAAICGRDTFPWCKPDARALLSTVERAGGDPARAVMIGDSVTDVDAARAAGIPVICVPFGYTDRPVAELGPDAVIDGFDGLGAAVDRLIGDGGRDRD